MESGTQRANRVDGIVITQLEAGHDVSNDPDHVAAGDFVVQVSRHRCSLRRCIPTWVLDGPGSVRVGNGGNRLTARATDGRSPEDVGELVLGAQRDAASERVATGDVLVQRRLPDPQSICHGRKRQARQTDLVGDPLTLLDDERLGESRPRHDRRVHAESGARRLR